MPEVDLSVSQVLRNRVSETVDDVRHLRWRVAAFVVAALVGAVVLGISHLSQNTATGVSNKSFATTVTTAPYGPTTTVPASVVLYVVGAVNKPGLYTVGKNARLTDAIDAAGGFAANADTMRLNLAAKVADGQRVYVVRKGEATSADVGIATSGAGGSTSAASGPVNINDATPKQLEELPGVGPATAAAIAQYREQHGAFGSVNDLAKVKGIGPSKLAQIVPAATV